jgi:hypothetical protein
MDADTSLATDLTVLLGDPTCWVVLVVYFAPTLVAVWYRCAAWPLCFWVNLFAGWTLIGWVACVFLASGPSREQVAYRDRVRRARDEFFLREAEKIESR